MIEMWRLFQSLSGWFHNGFMSCPIISEKYSNLTDANREAWWALIEMLLPTSCPLSKAATRGFPAAASETACEEQTPSISKLYHCRWLFTMSGLMSKAALLHAWHHFWKALWTSNKTRSAEQSPIKKILVHISDALSDSLSDSYGILMVFLWYSYGILIRFLLDSYCLQLECFWGSSLPLHPPGGCQRPRHVDMCLVEKVRKAQVACNLGKTIPWW